MNNDLLIFLLMLLCTPFGWVGMICLGIMLAMIIGTIRETK